MRNIVCSINILFFFYITSANFIGTKMDQNIVNASYYQQLVPSLRVVYNQLSFWVSVLFFLPSLVLNFCLSAVFLRKRFWVGSNKSMEYYYSVLPLASNAALTIGILNFLPTSLGTDLTLLNASACKLVWFCRILLLTSAEGLQMQMAIDRAINVIYPRRFSWFFARMSHLAVTSALIYLFVGVFATAFEPLRYLTFQNITKNNLTLVQAKSCNLEPTTLIVHNIILFVMRSVFITLIFVADVAIIYKLVQSKNHMAQQSFDHHHLSYHKKEFTFAVCVLSSNVLKILLAGPLLIVLLVQISYALKPNPPADYVAYINLIYSFTNILNYSYEALPFYINLGKN